MDMRLERGVIKCEFKSPWIFRSLSVLVLVCVLLDQTLPA